MNTALRMLLCTGIFLLSSSVQSQVPLQEQAFVLKRMIELHHVSPRPVNDQFSEDLFDSFLESLDNDHLYFTQSDLESLLKYRYLLDDELSGRGWNFFNAVISIYKKRLQQADSLVSIISQKPFDFTLADNLPAGFDTQRAKNVAELKTRWSKLLKYEVLSALTPIAVQQLATSGTIRKAEVWQKEAAVRNKIKSKYSQKIQHLLAADEFMSQCNQHYLSSLASLFDPHTAYFDMSAKKGFQTNLNTEGYYYGFGLDDNEKSEVVISSLMPGSPAWKCGQLNKDDVLLELQWEGQDPVDVSISSADEVNALIDESKITKLNITVRKANGQLASITLQKEKVENEQQFVKSFVLTGKQKIGYIYLPGFYTSWEDKSGSSCAADMAREIIKLKKEGIEGIILDVRFNGGGSLHEAVDLAGIFIDDGPLCLIKSKEGKIQTLKDMNRGTIWDGPLLMLVNGQSASASELVAAVLQDYNRAVIVGSRTHGKATAQQVLPIDTASSAPYAQNSKYGFVKITNGRLYRVTGKTAQASGVEPDIRLPDVYNREEWHEGNLPFALKADTVKKNGYYKPLMPLPLSQLQQSSSARIKANVKFRLLQDIQASLLRSEKDSTISLRWDDMEKGLISELKYKQAKGLLKASTAYTVNNHTADQTLLKNAVTSGELNQHWFSRLAQDAYIEESFLILSDLIQSAKK